MSKSEQLKKFLFSSKRNVRGEIVEEKIEVIIPELLQASYSFYTWPSAPVLAWFIWENRHEFRNKRILEIGSGTGLPGIVAAKCGACVTLSESAILPKSIQHTKRSCQLNGLSHVNVIGLTWGLFLDDLTRLNPIDYIIASDCFYEPTAFEDVIVTVDFLLESNSKEAKFICAYQERSSDWSIEDLLLKWNLECVIHDISNLGGSAGVNISDLVGDHSIHLLEIYKKLYVSNIPWTVGSKELKTHFSKFGHINQATVVFDKKTGLSKNYGFVTYGNREGVDNALKQSVHKIDNSIIRVEISEQK